MISLVNVPSKYPFINITTPPVGLGYICSYLQSKNIDAEIYDLGIFPISIAKAVDLILQQKPENLLRRNLPILLLLLVDQLLLLLMMIY
ncbi:MAG: hypothetical protein ACTSRP_21575 [Candidatus Helarchaeota archaeon]